MNYALLFVSLIVSDQATGTIEITDVGLTAYKEVEVPACVQGALVSVGVEEGDSIQQGASLMVVDDMLAKRELEQATLRVAAAKAEAGNELKIELAKKKLALATADLQRGRRSIARYPGSIPAEEMQERELAVSVAELEVRQAEFDRKQAVMRVQLSEGERRAAQQELAKCQIIAPLTGVVTAVERQGGEWVEPGQTVVRVVRLDRLRAEGFVSTTQVKELRPGLKVELAVEGQSQPARGVLKFVDPRAHSVDGRVRISAVIDNRDRQLLAGSTGTMTIQLSPSTPQ